MSVLDAGFGRSALLPYTAMFGLHSVLGTSHKTDPRQDSSSSTSSKSMDSKTPDLVSRGSSTFSFLSRSNKRLAAEPSFELSSEAAIRPSFCWNNHQDTWQVGGVWSQFESGLKSCQDDVCACTNFMGHKDAAFAGMSPSRMGCWSMYWEPILYMLSTLANSLGWQPLFVIMPFMRCRAVALHLEKGMVTNSGCQPKEIASVEITYRIGSQHMLQQPILDGVFDGHGFNGRSAATYASKNITKWLSVDSNAASKDPKRRSKALESVCSQIDRGLARQELCGFDASSSGLTACFGILHGNKICLASIGTCKAVLGRTDTESSSRLHAICLSSSDGTHPRTTSETRARVSGHGVRPMHSMPAPSPFATHNPPPAGPPEGLLGRGPLGELTQAPPVMSVHQLTSQDQFVAQPWRGVSAYQVMATSGVWEVMTAQEAVDFVHQCRQCRPDNLSCSQALTLEAHTRWKLRFSKVIAEDVAAVIIHCGGVPQPAQPGHRLPAFPDAAATNQEANDEHTLHETREFWGRLQSQSLVPLLQSASSKGKGHMPSAYLPIGPPSASKPKGHLPSSNLPIEQSFPSQSDAGAASSSHSGPRDSLLAYDSSAFAAWQEGSGHSRDISAGGRSVHFALPLEADSSDDSDSGQPRLSTPEADIHSSRDKQSLDDRQQASSLTNRAKVPQRSPAVDISFRPDTPDASSDHTPRIASSSGRSSMLSHDFPDSEPNASAPFSDSQSVQTPSANPSTAPNPFAAAALIRAGWEDSEAESEFSTPRSSFDRQDPRHSSSHGSSSRTARAVPKSPRSPSRAHAQQPLDESEGGKLLLAKLSMMERTHSAPGGLPFGMLVDFAVGASRPRIRLPVSIPEDRAVAPAAPAQAADTLNRPFRKIYPHGSSEDLDTLEADLPEIPQPMLPPSLSVGSVPRAHSSSASHEGRVHSKQYPTSSQLLSGASLPRVTFPKLHAPVFSAPERAGEMMEGQVRRGFPRTASHPENLADLAAATDTPFARYPLQSVSPQPYSGGSSAPSPYQHLANLVNGTSGSATTSIDPWASPSQHGGNLLKARRSSALGNRNRNGSAALDELTRLRSKRA